MQEREAYMPQELGKPHSRYLYYPDIRMGKPGCLHADDGNAMPAPGEEMGKVPAIPLGTPDVRIKFLDR